MVSEENYKGRRESKLRLRKDGAFVRNLPINFNDNQV